MFNLLAKNEYSFLALGRIYPACSPGTKVFRPSLLLLLYKRFISHTYYYRDISLIVNRFCKSFERYFSLILCVRLTVLFDTLMQAPGLAWCADQWWNNVAYTCIFRVSMHFARGSGQIPPLGDFPGAARAG